MAKAIAILCEDIDGENSRCIPIVARRPDCDPGCVEQQEPSGYVARAEWAEFMLETHDQRQCPGCGLWTIWEPRPVQFTASDDREEVSGG